MTLASQRVTGEAVPARTLAMMHTAMFNAVNAVAKDYKRYAVAPLADAPDASPETAAHTGRDAFWPSFTRKRKLRSMRFRCGSCQAA